MTCSSSEVNQTFLCKLHHQQSCGALAYEGDEASKFFIGSV